ncbi:hypothetical protein TcasGA2_TC001415 [Tribolium castaneum]|uniref:Uncharacterized protein n=1 Tax=Tribolium castaneum TaxID=7070 RepID=D7EK16_TRICA|nr:PREDICTED: putative uncharacterized protein DDB_G0282499 [Tribolium castaneum]EFA12964.1 hypothetical protein TcasGA2_TC001415 [Tribolium castaneum]|eukprot:XP_008200410.1 PREDICTED: putative uncharacterized protein DDB_G0282499 [Tribolium castaneum]
MWMWLRIFVVLFLHIQCEPTKRGQTALDESYDGLDGITTDINNFSGYSEDIVEAPNTETTVVEDGYYFIAENTTKVQNDKNVTEDNGVDDNLEKVHKNDNKTPVNIDSKTQEQNLTKLENISIPVNTTSYKPLTSSTSSSTSTSSSSSSTSTSTTEPPAPVTISKTTPFEEDTDDHSPIFKGFNWNYLFYLFLLVPATGIPVGLYYYCKKRRKKGQHVEAKRTNNRNRRFSTPSWVFSEPDFIDEEVITLEEEKTK